MKCITVVVIHAVIILLGAYCDIDPPSSSSPSELVILSNDFESGIGDDWEEKSPHPLDICWRVENDTNSDGADVPQPISGGNVLRTFKSSRYGSLVLLKSPMVEIVSGDQFSFSFWIHSHMEGTNNLEVYISPIIGQSHIFTSLSRAIPRDSLLQMRIRLTHSITL